MFGTAAAAQRLHGIVPGLPNASGHRADAQGILEVLDGQFDALAAAFSASNAALDQLAAATIQKYLEIKAALTNLAAATPSKNAGTRTGTIPTDQRETEKRILILQSDVTEKNGTWEASAPHTATASAPVTSAATSTARRTAKPMPQPAHILLAREKTSTRDGTTGSCERIGGKITKIK